MNDIQNNEIVKKKQNNKLKSFIERIERLEEKKNSIIADIKKVYSEAKSFGYNLKIMKSSNNAKNGC